MKQTKPIRLFETDVDCRGVINIWRIYKTHAGRTRAKAAFIKRYPCLDYEFEWKDVQGYGLQLSRYLPTLAKELAESMKHTNQG